jgi:thiamine-phosphate pyrophosphorylase
MELIVISHPSNFPNEGKIITALFEEGLQTFHLRKPKWDKNKTADFLSSIPSQYHKHIVLHHHHSLAKTFNIKGLHYPKKKRKNPSKTKWLIRLKRIFNKNLTYSASLHSLGSIPDNDFFDYVFLSPVFDSISKKGYGQAFTPGALKYAINNAKTKVIALGGVSPKNISKAKEYGFSGVALLGAIWNYKQDPVEVFKTCKAVAKQNITPVNIKPIQLHIR